MLKRPVEVRLFDGIFAKARTVWIVPHSSQELAIYTTQQDAEHLENLFASYCYQDMQYISEIGVRKPLLILAEQRRIEFISRPPYWLNIRHKQLYHAIWTFERSPLYIFSAMLLVCMLVVVMMKWGIPFAAQQTARVLPEKTLVEVGNQTEQRLLQTTSVSQLDLAEQHRLEHLFRQHIAEGPEIKLVFRHGGKDMGANAAAIPNNTIFISDELIQLSGCDEEVLAVLAHEQGHLLHKHSLQKVISNIGVVGVIALLMGDLTDVTTASVILLTDANYSRELEFAADDYAMRHLTSRNISSLHLSNFLQRVENIQTVQQQRVLKNLSIDIEGKERHLTEQEIKWINALNKLKHLLQSHPDNTQRIQRIHAYADGLN